MSTNKRKRKPREELNKPLLEEPVKEYRTKSYDDPALSSTTTTDFTSSDNEDNAPDHRAGLDLNKDVVTGIQQQHNKKNRTKQQISQSQHRELMPPQYGASGGVAANSSPSASRTAHNGIHTDNMIFGSSNMTHQQPFYDIAEVSYVSGRVLMLIIMGAIAVFAAMALISLFSDIGDTSHESSNRPQRVLTFVGIPAIVYLIVMIVCILFYREARRLRMEGYLKFYDTASEASKNIFRLTSLYFVLGMGVVAAVDIMKLQHNTETYLLWGIWLGGSLMIVIEFCYLVYLSRTHNQLATSPDVFGSPTLENHDPSVVQSRGVFVPSSPNMDSPYHPVMSGRGTGGSERDYGMYRTTSSMGGSMDGGGPHAVMRELHKKNRTLNKQVKHLSKQVLKYQDQLRRVTNPLGNGDDMYGIVESGGRVGRVGSMPDIMSSGGSGPTAAGSHQRIAQLRDSLRQHEATIRNQRGEVQVLNTELQTRAAELQASHQECEQLKRLLSTREHQVATLENEKERLEKRLNKATREEQRLTLLVTVNSEAVESANVEISRLKDQNRKLSNRVQRLQNRGE